MYVKFINNSRIKIAHLSYSLCRFLPERIRFPLEFPAIVAPIDNQQTEMKALSQIWHCNSDGLQKFVCSLPW